MILVGIGGNVGSEAQLRERFVRAREAMGAIGRVRSAPLYRSAPIGPIQPPYLNTVVSVELADAAPGDLIATILSIEGRLGRQRDAEVRWGPRAIDLDVLVWDDRRIRTPELEVPHPRIAERRFVLEPLVALVGADFAIPGVGRAGELLSRVGGQACELISAVW